MKEGEIPATTSRSLPSLSLRQGILQKDKAYKVMEGITMNSILHIPVSFLGYVIKSLSIPISFSFSKISLQNIPLTCHLLKHCPIPIFPLFQTSGRRSLYLGFPLLSDTYLILASCCLASSLFSPLPLEFIGAVTMNSLLFWSQFLCNAL